MTQKPQTTYAIAVGVADVRRDPNPESELVTQALLNMPASAQQISGDWTHVQLSDYEGWVLTEQLAEPVEKGFTRVGPDCATPLDLVAVITATRTPLYSQAEGDAQSDHAYLSTLLPLLDDTHPQRVQVALPGGESAWLDREAVAIRRAADPYPKDDVRKVIEYAMQFRNVPYLWGGTSWEGIDCSGFVQVNYRMGGYIIPRDADQQHDFLPQSVSREEMQAGDLIFFGTKAITHVGMAISATDYIHAEGRRYNYVVVNSFERESPIFNDRLADIVWGIKRVVSDHD
ncbi:NLP/P60 [Ktedonobacter sp. SOSP1-85]|uniref:C40 family peptidase n=1 Tax=Ktedonobacter sp. SOSP1-85 TaxID=2778367 RepID=UPI001915A33A|nr:C40 family peptidase [Ktedonobacter sp. SOSP1-85]GHO75513.1 NLP/P60 [Ktedonobacter sp. SOSP1-85]